MKRRDFLSRISKLLFVFTPMGSLIFRSVARGQADSAFIPDLEEKEVANSCQSINLGEADAALKAVNPGGQAGLLARSVGCKSPHKHFLFIPARYIQNPELIEREADATTPEKIPAKTFVTSAAFDRSWLVRIATGAHTHTILLTRSDLELIKSSPDGIRKIAYQKKLLFGGTEPGHIFHLKA